MTPWGNATTALVLRLAAEVVHAGMRRGGTVETWERGWYYVAALRRQADLAEASD